MSKQVDERVVSMQFDNAQFEKNVQTSMSTIDKLKEKLKLTDSAKGFENLNTSVKKVDLNPISQGIETVKSRFSALEIAGITALANLANSAVNYGKRIVSSLTIDPITQGFGEYELKLNSIQVIRANTDNTLDEIEEALDDLNTYADKTIYNYSQMTSNVGKFVAQGLDVFTASNAVKGMANLAAASGASAEDMARATYQMSQALGGTIRKIDWNSLRNANMATVRLKEALMDLARVNGIAIDDMIEEHGTFEDTLEEGWLSGDLFTEAMNIYSGVYDEATLKAQGFTDEQVANFMKLAETAEEAATSVKTYTQLMDTLKEGVGSGWAQSWEIIVGDFEEAKNFWTSISNVLNGIVNTVSNVRNNFLKSLFDSKWERISDAVKDAGINIEDFKEKLTETAKTHGVDLDAMIEKYGSLGKALNHVKNVKEIVSETFKKFTGIGSDASEAIDKVSDTTEKVTTNLEHFQEVVNNVIRGDFGNGEERINALTEAGEKYAIVQGLVNKVWERTDGTWSDTTITAEDLSETISNLSDEELEAAGYTREEAEALKEVADQAEEAGVSIDELLEDMDKQDNRELLTESFSNIVNVLKKLGKAAKSAWTDIFPPGTIHNVMSTLVAKFHDLTENLKINKDTFNNIKKTLKGVIAAFSLVGKTVGSGVNTAFKILKAFLGGLDMDFFEFTAKLGDNIVKFREWIKQFDILTPIISTFVPMITNAVKSIKDWAKSNKSLNKSFKKIKSLITSVVDSIKDWIEGFKDAKDIPKHILDGLQNGLTDGISKIGEIMSEIGNVILDTIKEVLGIKSPSTKFFEIGQNIIAGLVNGILAAVNAIWDLFKSIGEKIISMFKDQSISKAAKDTATDLATDVVDSAGKIVDSASDILKNAWDKICDFGKNIFSKVADFFKALDFGKVLAVALSGSLIVGIKEIIGIFKMFKPVLSGIGDVLEGAGDALEGLGKSLQANVWEKRGKAILMIAAAIGILAGSIYLLTKIDDGAKLKSAVKAISTLIIVMGVFAILMDKLGNTQKTKISKSGIESTSSAIKSIIAIGAAMLLVAIALKKVASIDPESLTPSVNAMLKLIVAMGVVAFALGSLASSSKRNGANMDSAASMILAIGVTLVLVAYAVKIAGTLKLGQVIKGIAVMAAFTLMVKLLIAVTAIAGNNADKAAKVVSAIGVAFLLVAVAVKIAGTLEVGQLVKGIAVMVAFTVMAGILIGITALAGNNAAKAGVAILAISAAFLIVAFALKVIGSLDVADVIIGILVLRQFTYIVEYLILVTTLAGSNAAKAGVAILAISGAFLLMAFTMKILSSLEVADVLIGVLVLRQFTYIVSYLISITSLAGNNAVKAGITILAIAGAMLILSACVFILGQIELPALVKGVTAISILMIVFATVLTAADLAQGSLKNLIVLTVAVALLAIAVAALSFIPADKLAGATVALSVVMLIFAGLIYVSKFATESIASLIVMTVAIAVLAGALYLIAQLPIENALAASISLSVLLIAMGVALALTGSLGPTALWGVAAMMVMVVVIVLLAKVLEGLSELPVQTTLGITIALSILLLSMAAALAIAGILGPLSIVGAVALGLLAVIMLLIAKIIKDLAELPLTSTLVITMALSSFLLRMSEACLLLALVGILALPAIVGIGVLAAVIVAVGGLMAVMGKLTEHNSKLEEFINKGIPLLNLIGNGLGQFFGNIVSGFLDTVSDSVMSSLIKVGTGLTLFALSIKPFIAAVKDIDPSVIDSIKTLVEAILLISAGNLIDSITSWLTGGNSMEQFAAQLTAFGEAIIAFSKTVTGKIKTKSVTAAAEAGKAMAELAKAIPKTDGLIQKLLGEQDIADFGAKCVAFGAALMVLSATLEMGNLNSEAIIAAAEAGKAMSELANNIPKSDGIVQDLLGEQDISTFGNKCVAFVAAILALSAALSLGEINKDNIQSAIDAGKQMLELQDVLPKSGGWWQEIAGEKDIADFGAKISAFADSMSEFSEKLKDVKVGKSASIVTIAKRLSLVAETVSEINDDTLKDFGQDSIDLAEKLEKFSEKASEIDPDQISQACSAVTELCSTLANVTLIDSSSINAFVESFKSLGEVSVDNFVKAFEDGASKAKKAGEDMIAQTKDGIEDNGSDIEDAAVSVAEDAADAVSDSSDDFESAGEDLGEGLVQGIENKEEAVYEAGFKLGEKAVQGEKDGQKSNSPSKLTIQAGKWLGEGLVIGINAFGNKVYKAGGELGKTATDSLSGSISRISDIVDSDIDAQPTIRPVLDLSDVADGADAIDGILGFNRAIGVSTNLGAKNTGYSRNQNGATDEVVGAIKDLKKAIGKTTGDTYQINGVTYDDGSNITDAVKALIRAARVERRV